MKGGEDLEEEWNFPQIDVDRNGARVEAEFDIQGGGTGKEFA